MKSTSEAKIIKFSVYSSRRYRIEVMEFEDGTAFAIVCARKKYKHGIYRWQKNTKKTICNRQMHRWFESSCFLADYATDYNEYNDCIERLKYSHCARNWFKRIMKPYMKLNNF